MGLLEPLTHKNEIENLLSAAQNTYDTAKEKYTSQKNKTIKSLENLGKEKKRAWHEDMEAFVSSFASFKNVQLERVAFSNSNFLGYDKDPKEMLISIGNESLNVSRIEKMGFAAVGVGTLMGVAGIGIGFPIAAFAAAMIAGNKGKEQLAEAKKKYAQAENAAAQINIITFGMQGVEKMSNNYLSFIKKLSKKFVPFVKELDRIKSIHTCDQDGLINFDILSNVEQKTLHLSWLMAQIFYHVLATPILTSNGEVSFEAQNVLKVSKADLKHVRKETCKKIGIEAPADNLVWKPMADILLQVNFYAMGFFITLGLWTLEVSILKGLLFVACAVLTCPVFFFLWKVPSSRLFVLRLLRLIVSIGLSIVVLVFL